jgi:hypothetical protein
MVVSSVSSPGVVNHLKRFLDDIVFISKTQDMCRKQSEVVSALQSHFETCGRNNIMSELMSVRHSLRAIAAQSLWNTDKKRRPSQPTKPTPTIFDVLF